MLKLVDEMPICSSSLSHFISSFEISLNFESLLIAGGLNAILRLLDMYLHPNDGKEPMFRAAVRLLHNHGDSLDPMQVLEVQPISLSD